MEEDKCIKTGIDELDRILKGGLPKGVSVLFLSPEDTDFDDLLVAVVEGHLEDKKEYVGISLLCPPMFVDTVKNYKNFTLVCSELGSFFHLKDERNVIITDPASEKMMNALDEIMTRKIAPKNTIALINISSIQFYHGLIPTVEILEELLSFFKENKVSSIIGYIEINERSSPSLADIENLFEGCLQLLHAKLEDDTKKFMFVKKMKDLSASYELVPIIFEE